MNAKKIVEILEEYMEESKHPNTIEAAHRIATAISDFKAEAEGEGLSEAVMTKRVLERALEMALKLRFDGDCPFDSEDTMIDCKDNPDNCKNGLEKCWAKYFIRKAKEAKK
jgi:hypothetical protein